MYDFIRSLWKESFIINAIAGRILYLFYKAFEKWNDLFQYIFHATDSIYV